MKRKTSKYKTLEEETYYKTGIGRGVIRVSEDKSTKNKTVTFSKEVKTKNNWVTRKGKFFTIPFRFITKVIDILLDFSKKFGWKTSYRQDTKEQVKVLKEQLDNVLKQKLDLEETNKKLELDIKKLKDDIKYLRNRIIKNNISLFRQDISKLKELLNKSESEKVYEEELQKFLKENPWLFSPEYHNTKPKKPVGSKSIFDFYLEDYKRQGTVIELKLPSDAIFKEDYEFSSKLGEALGQLIRYVESTIAYSHGKITSKIEEIDEIRPLGFLIIGRTKSKEEIEKLKIVNSYLHFIQILSYDLLLARAQSFLEPFKGDENER